MIRPYRIIIPKRKDQSQKVLERFWLLSTAVRVYDGLHNGKDKDHYRQTGLFVQTFSWRTRRWTSLTNDEIMHVLLRSLSVRNPS